MKKMKEKEAIVITAVLGIAVFLLLFKVWVPFVWAQPDDAAGGATAAAVSGTAVADAGTDTGSDAGTGIPEALNPVIPGGDASKAAEKETGKKHSKPVVVSDKGTTILTRIALPDGYTRTEAGEEDLATYIRNYPLKKKGAKVKLYNGQDKSSQDAQEAVFKLPIENENLQQAAGSVIRMYAEYMWKTKQYDRISFRFASGFEANYKKWRNGYRILIGGSGAYWTTTKQKKDVTYDGFKKYLRMVFAYSSTASLLRECKKTTLSDLKVGDVFIQSGSSRHAAMVVDICENAQGKKAFLLAQGYTPAQQFHILKNPAHEDSPWYFEDEISYPLKTPEYSFRKGSLMHPGYLD